VFGLACGTSWLLYLHRYAFAVIKPELVREWQLSKVELGLLDSAFSLSSTLFQFPLGIATDWLGVHLMLTCLLLVWCLGLAMHAWARSPDQLWYARAAMGIGQSAVYANLSRMAQCWFPASIRTTLQGIAAITAGRLGGMCAYLLLGSLLLGRMGLDWRTAIYVFVAGGLVFTALFAVIFRNSPREHLGVNAAEAAMFGPTHDAGRPYEGGRESLAVVKSQSSKAEFRQRLPTPFGQLLRSIKPRALVNLIMLNIQTILSTLADNIYSSWIPLFLWEVHHLKFEAMGIYSSLPLFGGAIAGMAGGALNDWCIARTGNRRWSRSGIAALGKGLAAALLLVALVWYDNPYVFCVFLFTVKFVGDWSLSTSWGVVTDIGGRMTASVFAFNNAVAGIGFIVAPVLFGYLAQHHGWTAVFIAVAITYILCAASWLVIDCTIPMVDEQ